MDNTDPQKSSPAKAGTPNLNVPHQSGPKILSRLSVAVFIVAALIVLSYAEEYWRGRQGWRAYRATMSSQGMPVEWEAYIPPPVPDDQNFAMTPFLTPLYDFVPGTQTHRDTNAVNKIYQTDRAPYELAKRLGFELNAERYRGWEQGEPADLIELLGRNEAEPQPLKTAGSAASSVPWPTNQPQAATILLSIFRQTFDPIVDELRTASQRPYCRFNVKYDAVPVAAMLLPHLAKMKSIEQKLSWRASAELVLGQTNEAFADVMLGLYVSDAIKGEPLLISDLVRLANRTILTQAIWEGMARHQWTDAQLQQLQAGLAKDDFCQDTEHSLLAERAGNARLVDQLRNRTGGFSIEDLADDISAQMGIWRVLYHLSPKGWLYFEQINVCKGYDRLLLPFQEWRHQQTDAQGFLTSTSSSEHEFDHNSLWRRLWTHHLLEGLLLPAADRAQLKAMQAQVRSDLTRVACALERYRWARGSYPENLNALVPSFIDKLPLDLMSGQPLLWRRETPQSYVLYSVGENFLDDGGTVVTSKKGTTRRDAGDWAWIIPGTIAANQ